MTMTANATRWFTPEKAEKTLPLVSLILTDIKELRESVKSRQTRIDELLKDRGDGSSSPYQDELESMRRSLDEDRRQMREFVRELTTVGAEVVENDELSVEFPAWLDHRAVRLRWTLGQPHVSFYRELKDPTSMYREAGAASFGEGPDVC